jgi:hypothetical protein
VPTAPRGTDGWRRLERWRVSFGEPLRLDDLAGLEPAPASREATGRMWARLRELEAGLDAS